MRRVVWLPLMLSLVILPTVARCGANPYGTAWLSWDINEVICDLDTMPTGFTWLYIQLGNIGELRGCEFLLMWAPPGIPGSRCFEFVDGEHPSGIIGGHCIWLMRGSQVEGVNLADDFSWLIAFAGDECNAVCSSGNVARVMIDFAGCTEDMASWFCLQYVKVTDCSAVIDVLTVMSDAALFGGVGADCPCELPAGDVQYGCTLCDWAKDPVSGSTWGSIKAMYR
jgi:hypothetical protein